MKNEEKCLVNEALEKCNCETCKFFKQARDISIKYYTQSEIMKVYMDAFKKEELTQKIGEMK
jgi:hypothetical protein